MGNRNRTSPFPRLLSLARAQELLYSQCKKPREMTDHIASLWHSDPKFIRKAISDQYKISTSTLNRMLNVLDEANDLLTTPGDNSNDGREKTTAERKRLGGLELLAMIDTQLVEADREGRNRDFQVLLSARQQIADASSEVAAGAVDPMRLCGKAGLDGMPQRVISVLEVIKPHMKKRYPALWTYLCEFGKNDSPEAQHE